MIHETDCAVCHARANSGHKFGFRNQRLIQACKDGRCQALLPKVYKMSKKELDAFEMKAVEHGGAMAGAYLDELGKYNLGELFETEWNEFCARMVTGYRERLKFMLENNEAPF